jgi:hypothetical protein
MGGGRAARLAGFDAKSSEVVRVLPFCSRFFMEWFTGMRTLEDIAWGQIR